MHGSDAESVRVSLTLDSEIYEHVKEMSSQFGLRPSTWMRMVVTTKVNNIELALKAKDK